LPLRGRHLASTMLARLASEGCHAEQWLTRETARRLDGA
jgi:hypothetical protein